MKQIFCFLFLFGTCLVFGQGNQLITHEQPIPCLNKKFTILVHIVEDEAGELNITEEVISQQVADLDTAFMPMCVSFEVCEFRTIPNFHYDNIDNDDWAQMQIEYHQQNRINLFYVSDISGIDPAACGFASLGGIAMLEQGGIVIKKDCDGTTLIHEMGHYFGLVHTFEGNGDENVSGDNCETAGDLLCDTAADPYDPEQPVSNYVDASNCRFIFQGQDANGEFYRPDVGNYMSYYPSNCSCGFTTDQFFKMAEICKASMGRMW